jgi:hypothetical protein
MLLTCQKYLAASFRTIYCSIVLLLIAFPDRAGPAFATGRFEGWLALLLVAAFAIGFDKGTRRER